MSFTPRPGGCLCGAVRYELVADPVTLYACHCTDCQTATGSAFALSMIVAREALALRRGEPAAFVLRLPDGRERRTRRCTGCDTTLWGEPPAYPQLRNLQPGTLDETRWLAPVGHIWTRSAQPWVVLPPDALRCEGQPEDMLPLVRAWKARSSGLAAAAETPATRGILVNVDVGDLERAIAFYTAALGLRVVRRIGPDIAELAGAEAPLYLTAHADGSAAFPGAATWRRWERHWTPVHLDFRVARLEPALQRAQAAGARVEGPVRDFAGARYVVLSDPFGNGFCLLEAAGGSGTDPYES